MSGIAFFALVLTKGRSKDYIGKIMYTKCRENQKWNFLQKQNTKIQSKDEKKGRTVIYNKSSTQAMLAVLGNEIQVSV